MADNIANILKQQKEIADYVKQRLDAYEATPQERKNKAFLLDKKEKLDQKWRQFKENDSFLRKNQDVPDSHQYYATGYMEHVKELVVKYQGAINEDIEKLKQYEDGDIDMSTVANQQQVMDPAILFRASSNLEGLNMDSGNAQQDPRLATMQIYLANVKEMIQEFNEKEKQLSELVMKTKVAMIIKKWEFISAMHEKMALIPGYNYKEYLAIEGKIGKFLMKAIAEKEEQASASQSAKLPKLEIPKFKGDHIQWESFKQLFQKMIGQKKNLDDTEKFAYLKGQLEEEPHRIIASLPVQGSSYKAAWDILETRFNDQQMLLRKLLDKMNKGDRMNGNSIQNMKEVYDGLMEAVAVIKNMNIPCEELVECIMYYFLERKLDLRSLNLYENTLTNIGELRKFKPLTKFMNIRIHNLSVKNVNMIENFQRQIGNKDKHQFQKKKVSIALTANASSNVNDCGCKEKHNMWQCPEFIKKSVSDRVKFIRKMKKCGNCLKDGHIANECKGRKCIKCGKAHNSLLHYETTKKSPAVLVSSQKQNQGMEHVFLATVMVDIIDKYGRPMKARALLDSGAQINLMTDKMQKKLGVVYKKTDLEVQGIGAAKTEARKRLTIHIKSPVSKYETDLEVFTLKKIANEQPEKEIDCSKWEIPETTTLSDPKFNIPAKIDLIIGGELFYSLILKGTKPLGNGLPNLQKTVFGWAVTGKAMGLEQHSAYVGIATSSLEKKVEKFWELEEKTREDKPMNQLEIDCENFFEETTVRDKETGRFRVKLQFLKHPSILGNSERTAIRRFLNIEGRFKRDPAMKEDYVKFMKEYEELGHMTRVNKEDIAEQNYFIPHHAVRNQASSTTKFRVVFDASSQSTTKISLNEILANGPVLDRKAHV